MDVPIYPFRLASEQKEHIESIIKFVGGSFIHTNKNLLKANDHIKKIDRNFLKELGLHFESKRDSLEATMSGRTEAQMKNVHNGKEKNECENDSDDICHNPHCASLLVKIESLERQLVDAKKETEMYKRMAHRANILNAFDMQSSKGDSLYSPRKSDMPETPVKSDDQRPSNGVPFKVDLALGDELALQGQSRSVAGETEGCGSPEHAEKSPSESLNYSPVNERKRKGGDCSSPSEKLVRLDEGCEGSGYSEGGMSEEMLHTPCKQPLVVEPSSERETRQQQLEVSERAQSTGRVEPSGEEDSRGINIGGHSVVVVRPTLSEGQSDQLPSTSNSTGQSTPGHSVVVVKPTYSEGHTEQVPHNGGDSHDGEEVGVQNPTCHSDFGVKQTGRHGETVQAPLCNNSGGLVSTVTSQPICGSTEGQNEQPLPTRNSSPSNEEGSMLQTGQLLSGEEDSVTVKPSMADQVTGVSSGNHSNGSITGAEDIASGQNVVYPDSNIVTGPKTGRRSADNDLVNVAQESSCRPAITQTSTSLSNQNIAPNVVDVTSNIGSPARVPSSPVVNSQMFQEPSLSQGIAQPLSVRNNNQNTAQSAHQGNGISSTISSSRRTSNGPYTSAVPVCAVRQDLGNGPPVHFPQAALGTAPKARASTNQNPYTMQAGSLQKTSQNTSAGSSGSGNQQQVLVVTPSSEACNPPAHSTANPITPISEDQRQQRVSTDTEGSVQYENRQTDEARDAGEGEWDLSTLLINLPIRMLRIGSFWLQPVDCFKLTIQGVQMTVTHSSWGEKCLQVHIGCGELQHILCHLGAVNPCLFLDISPSCAQRLGQALVEQQPVRSNFIAGPRQQKIMIVVEKLDQGETKKYIRSLLTHIQTELNITAFFQELNSSDANQWIAALSRDVTVPTQQQRIYPPPGRQFPRARGQTHAVPRQPVQRGVGWRSAGQRGPAPVIEIPDNPQDMGFQKRLVLLQPKNSRVKPQLLEVRSNCDWSAIRTRIPAVMTRLLGEQRRYPELVQVKLENFVVNILPKPPQQTKVPKDLVPKLKAYFVHPICIKITRQQQTIVPRRSAGGGRHKKAVLVDLTEEEDPAPSETSSVSGDSLSGGADNQVGEETRKNSPEHGTAEQGEQDELTTADASADQVTENRVSEPELDTEETPSDPSWITEWQNTSQSDAPQNSEQSADTLPT